MVHTVERNDATLGSAGLSGGAGAPKEEVLPFSLIRAEIYFSSSNTSETALPA